MKKLFLFLFAAIFSLNIAAQSSSTTIVLRPRPIPQLGPGQRTPVITPSAYIVDGTVYVQFKDSVDFTIQIESEDGAFSTQLNYINESSAHINGLDPNNYIIIITITSPNQYCIYEGEFEIE